jgi:CheY-like chemotaxis protein
MNGKAKASVFVIEDHPATARGLKMFLQLSGYEVEIATDMRSALARLEIASFDVLVCDLSLPDGTGWDLMETLRRKKAVRAIAFSAFNEPEQIARSEAAGFIEHVVKGTTPETLVAAIQRVLRVPLSKVQPPAAPLIAPAMPAARRKPVRA